MDKMTHPPHFDAFAYWITERQAVYINRLNNPTGKRQDWTRDPIFHEYSFCNVFRELDRVTRWIHEHFRLPYAEHPNLWFMMCVARQINWPPTLAATLEAGLPGVWDPARVRASLWARQAQKQKVYTGAYMLRGDIQNPDSSVPNDKPTYTCFKVLDPVWKAAHATRCSVTWRSNLASAQCLSFGLEMDHFSQTIEGWTRWLESFHGWGGFLAYEVATDLRHTRYLRNAPDIYTWANPGPGAKRGLNRLWGRPLNQAVQREQAIEEMQLLLERCRAELPWWVSPYAKTMKPLPNSPVANSAAPMLEMRDIEHSLCETDKYLRVKNGEGRPRAKFKPWNGVW